ncbi:cytochrome c-type biogenesis protein [Vibrio ziniensis]|uniref:Cytochrome c-type biogenesis protein n=1 Tax=Vibrio ziniensis TaxID=2711221 RepID=A0A6G7CJY1_9VIBR|nr:cytochrome c-type biogenesis protein [Vibrio ziniensis]QIH42348.1 cytochrome c-type biogenesis protein CcmH [Vibrio ziniensis]
MRAKLFALVSSVLLSFSVIAAIDVYDFDTQAQEAQFHELSNTLRCPKCQNNSIADSNAALAQDLRQKVYEMTKQGKSKDEIVDYMIARYGNFVTYNPPLTPSTAILWLAPISVLVVGLAMIIFRTKRRSRNVQAIDWDESKEQRLKALLEEDKDGDKQE